MKINKHGMEINKYGMEINKHGIEINKSDIKINKDEIDKNNDLISKLELYPTIEIKPVSPLERYTGPRGLLCTNHTVYDDEIDCACNSHIQKIILKNGRYIFEHSFIDMNFSYDIAKTKINTKNLPKSYNKIIPPARFIFSTFKIVVAVPLGPGKEILKIYGDFEGQVLEDIHVDMFLIYFSKDLKITCNFDCGIDTLVIKIANKILYPLPGKNIQHVICNGINFAFLVDGVVYITDLNCNILFKIINNQNIMENKNVLFFHNYGHDIKDKCFFKWRYENNYYCSLTFNPKTGEIIQQQF